MSKKVKIGLVSLYVFENNGIRFLSASLREAGYKTYEIYFKDYVHHHFVPPTDDEIDKLIELLKKLDLDLVGISLRAGAYLPVAIEVTKRIKQELDVLVMWGGPHVSMAPENCLLHGDFLVIGEAEDAVCDVAAALEEKGEIYSLDNIWAKTENGIIKNKLRPLCQDLDSIAFRDFHSHDYKYWFSASRFNKGDPLVNERLYLSITSRGCLYNCSYCDVSSFRRLYRDNGEFFRYRSVENCLLELEYARKVFNKLKRVRFDDELFVPDMDWIKEFCEKYPRRIGLPFEILSDPRCLEERAVNLLAKAGLETVMIGIQGAFAINRRLYNRPVSDDAVIDIAKVFKRNKVKGIFQAIVDDPEATTTDRKQLLDLLLALPRPYDLYMFSLCHWPNAQRTRELLERGVIKQGDVEGYNNKVLTQFMADFSYERSNQETFFIALNQLANKIAAPRWLVRRLAKSEKLKNNPWPVVFLAKTANLAKLACSGLGMLLRGEMSLKVIKRWIHIFDSPST